MENDRITALLSATPPDVVDAEPDYPALHRRIRRRRIRRIAAGSVVAAVACVGLVLPLAKLSAIGGHSGPGHGVGSSGPAATSTSSSPDAGDEPEVGMFTCTSAGTEVATPEFAVQPDGVHLHVDNPGGAAALVLRSADGTKNYPVHLSSSSLTDDVTPFLGPGDYMAACTDDAAGTSRAASGSPSAWVPVTISDRAAVWTAPSVDCQESRERIVLTGEVVDGREGVPSLIRTAVNGVRDSDDVLAAAYPQSEQDIQYIVERDGASVAVVRLLARDLPSHDAALDVTSCDVSGIAAGQGGR